MTDAARATVWQASWKPWGEIENISGTILNNLRFPGQYFQIETGLAYNHHRHYDAVTGRYTQPDPLGFVDGPSVYQYAMNSPFMNTDPTGQAHTTVIRPIPVPPSILPGARSNLPFSPIPNSGSSACPPPPGDCDPDQHRNLQDEVDGACKRERACKGNMDSGTLLTRQIMNESCMRARNNINRLCFRGGDQNHRDQATEAGNAINRCRQLRELAVQR